MDSESVARIDPSLRRRLGSSPRRLITVLARFWRFPLLPAGETARLTVMRTRALSAVVAGVFAVSIALSGCSQSNEPVIAPVTMDAGDLQGETVELAVESYSGEVADPAVAEFVAGYTDGSATFNPGVKALSVGTTEVVLSNSDGGIQDVTFTVEVTEKK
jgi:hypothetical protein